MYLETYFDQYLALSDNKKESRVIYMILLIYFLKHIIMTTVLKMKNRLIHHQIVINKKL